MYDMTSYLTHCKSNFNVNVTVTDDERCEWRGTGFGKQLQAQ